MKANLPKYWACSLLKWPFCSFWLLDVERQDGRFNNWREFIVCLWAAASQCVGCDVCVSVCVWGAEEGGGAEFVAAAAAAAITISANYVLCWMDKGGVIESITTLSSLLETLLNLHGPIMPEVAPPPIYCTHIYMYFKNLENSIIYVTLLKKRMLVQLN